MGSSSNNDNVLNESEYIDNDNESKNIRLSDYRTALYEEFLTGGSRYYSNLQFLNIACAKLQKFMVSWQLELNEEERKYIACRMTYRQYISSPYWHLVTMFYRCKANFRCQRCGEQRMAKLSIHHKTYEHIGSELQHPEDIEVICARCHMKEHGIEEVENV